MQAEILQNSQKNTCARVSFLTKLQAEAWNFIKKETLAQVFSREFCENSENTFFTEHLRATVSAYTQKGIQKLFLKVLQFCSKTCAFGRFEVCPWTSHEGSLHATFFSKYTELLQLKNIFKIFWNYFWNILEINFFKSKNQSLFKKRGCFLKLANIDNNNLMGLLTVAGGSLLLSQEHIKEKRNKEESSDKKER